MGFRRARLVAAILIALVAFGLADAASALEVGAKAPDFSLPSSQGSSVKLSDLTAKGPVVLYTFIQAFTPT